MSASINTSRTRLVKWPKEVRNEIFCVLGIQEHHARCASHTQVAFEENDLIILICKHAVPTNSYGPFSFLVYTLMGCNSLLAGLLNAWNLCSDIVFMAWLVKVHAILIKLLGNLLCFDIHCEAGCCSMRSEAFTFTPV